MGLMGYVRSGLRQHWHVYGIIRDNSVDAFTPTLGFATKVVSVTVLLFFVLIGVVFWIASLHDLPDFDGAEPELVMRVPAHRPNRRALVLATTAFYGYVGQLVPQKEVQPPQETTLSGDITTADMVRSAARSWRARGSA